jgi:hypothetical protein
VRQRSSDEFRKVQQRIEKYKAQKARKSISLNEEKYLAERAALDDEEEKIKKDIDGGDPDDPVVERDYYFNEVLDITQDYVQLLTSGRIAAARP